MNHPLALFGVLVALVLLVGPANVAAQVSLDPAARPLQAVAGTAFTYQGQIKNADGPVNGTCDFQFSLWDSPSNTTGQIGNIQSASDLAVANGLFTASLDFGPTAFDGNGRWLQIAVACPSGSGSPTVLSPRQAITAAPDALFAAQAGTASSAGSATTADTAASAPWNGLTGVPGTVAFLAAPSPCANGQVATWTGAAWSCGDDANSGGTITGVTAGTGLTGGGTSGAVTVGLNPSYTDGRYQAKYLRTVVVGPGATQQASGSNLLAALSAVQNANPTPGPTTPYVLKIEPGVYDLGSQAFPMRSFVDVEGSGEGVTTITSTAYSGGATPGTGTVVGADNAELRFLTVANTSGNGNAVALYDSLVSPRITRVTLSATASGTANGYGVWDSSSSPTLDNVSIAVDGTAAGSATADVGIDASSSSPTVRDTTILVTTNNLNNTGTGLFITGSSQPTLGNVTIALTGPGGVQYGVRSPGVPPSSLTTLRDVVISLAGSGGNQGIQNGGAMTLSDTTVTAANGIVSYGFENQGTSVTIDDSRITASTALIISSGTTKIGASLVSGGVAVSSGTLVCAASYNSAYAVLNSSCL